jgi:hypothetical protein
MNEYPAPGQKLEDHPISQIFPMMETADLHALADSIEKHGQRDRIILLDGKILDGRNRWEACRLRGIEPKFAFFDPAIHGESPTDFVMDLNCRRRQLTASQKAAVAVEAMPFYAAEARERQRLNGQKNAGNLQQRHAPKPPVAPEDESQEVPDKEPVIIVESVGTVTGDGTGTALPPIEQGRATEIAASHAGVSETLVKAAAKLKDEAPAEFAKVKEGAQTVSGGIAKTAAKKDAAQKLADAKQRIAEVCGAELAAAVESGTRLKGAKEILAFAALDNDAMTKIQPLIEDGWRVAKAVKFKAPTLAANHKIRDLLDRAASGQTIAMIEGWYITTERAEGTAPKKDPAEFAAAIERAVEALEYRIQCAEKDGLPAAHASRNISVVALLTEAIANDRAALAVLKE